MKNDMMAVYVAWKGKLRNVYKMLYEKHHGRTGLTIWEGDIEIYLECM
jgi:uncharacterized protein (DUF927 family)